MNLITPNRVVPVRRSCGKWIVAGLVILLTPGLILGYAVWSAVTLDRDAALLRREVMAATNSDWHTRVQLDVGPVPLGLVRTMLHFVHHQNIEDARLALAAVRHASVGVYERNTAGGVATGQLFADTDRLMRDRGWTRLVGVAEGQQHVLVYTSDQGSDNRMDLCLAVVDGKELVVVSTRVDPEAVMKLVAKHAPQDFKAKLKLSKLSF